MGTSSKAIYQSDLWTFIGSWAFLVGRYVEHSRPDTNRHHVSTSASGEQLCLIRWQ